MDFLPDQSHLVETLIPTVVLCYLIIVGFVMILFSSVQEAAEDRPQLQTRWDIPNWSTPKLIAISALVALPSLIILVPLGVLISL